MRSARSIYVEITMRCEIDELWRRTQTPDIHEQWDLRFTDIEYLERPSEDEPQRFMYATRIGFGQRIEGGGETVGSHESENHRTSALRFWSEDRRSLIREGSGYWKYIDEGDRVRFLTRYDYETRFGALGAIFDRLVFRPLIGWATAWSFDRLRLWLEEGLDPAGSRDRALIDASARIGLAFVWVYQGLVPKLLFTERSGEIETVIASGVPESLAHAALYTAGAIEILVGVLMIALWRARWLYVFNVVAMTILGATVAISKPELYIWQFNPVTLNASMIALAIVGWISSRRALPSARRCLRTESKEKS